jgi:hypothetical protein
MHKAGGNSLPVGGHQPLVHTTKIMKALAPCYRVTAALAAASSPARQVSWSRPAPAPISADVGRVPAQCLLIWS